MTPMGDEEIEKWLTAVRPVAPTTPGEVTLLCADVEASGLDLNRVRIWVEDMGGWGFFDGVETPYFEIPETKAPAYDPEAMSKAEYDRITARSRETTD